MKVILEFTESQLAVLCRIASKDGVSFETMVAKAVMCYIDSKEVKQNESVRNIDVSDLEQANSSLVFRVSPNIRAVLPQSQTMTTSSHEECNENEDGETIVEEVSEFESEEEMTQNTTGESLFF